MRTTRVILQIEPTLKAAGEKAAAAEHRSLTGLIEKLLADLGESLDGPSDAQRPRPATSSEY